MAKRYMNIAHIYITLSIVNGIQSYKFMCNKPNNIYSEKKTKCMAAALDALILVLSNTSIYDLEFLRML